VVIAKSYYFYYLHIFQFIGTIEWHRKLPIFKKHMVVSSAILYCHKYFDICTFILLILRILMEV